MLKTKLRSKPFKMSKYSGMERGDESKTYQKRSRRREENGASESGKKNLGQRLWHCSGKATDQRTSLASAKRQGSKTAKPSSTARPKRSKNSAVEEPKTGRHQPSKKTLWRKMSTCTALESRNHSSGSGMREHNLLRRQAPLATPRGRRISFYNYRIFIYLCI